MFPRESPFLQAQQLQAEVAQLRGQLVESEAEIEAKHTKGHGGRPLLVRQKAIEGGKKGPLGGWEGKGEGVGEEGSVAGEGRGVVGGREEMDVGVQRVAEQKEELMKLRKALSEKEELIAALQGSVHSLQQMSTEQSNTIALMAGVITSLQLDNPQILLSPPNHPSQSPPAPLFPQPQRVLQSGGTTLQNIIIQNPKLREILSLYSRKRQEDEWKKTAELQQQLKLVTEENNFFEMQISQKQMKIEELLIEVDNLRDMQEHSDLKDLHYRIKEREEEIKELGRLVKEKITECQEYKAKCNQLETSLQEGQRKREKLEFQHYYLQEKVAEYEERNQKQTDQLEEMQAEKAKMKEKVHQLEESKQAADIQLSHFVLLVTNKDRDLQKLSRKLDYVQTNAKNKDKTILTLQGELKQAKSQLREARFMNQRCQQQLQDIKEIMAVSGQKLKILKREAVDNIECEINYELELQQAKKNQIALESQNQGLLLKHKRQEQNIHRMKEELKNLHLLTKKLKEVTHSITAEPEEDETTTFQILADDDFPPPESPADRHRAQLLLKLQQYSLQVQSICLKYHPHS